jgi:hypothetical protein
MDNTFWDEEKEPSCPFDMSRLESPEQLIESEGSVRSENQYVVENEGADMLQKVTEKKFPLL